MNKLMEELIDEKIAECEENICNLVKKVAQEEMYLQNLKKLTQPPLEGLDDEN